MLPFFLFFDLLLVNEFGSPIQLSLVVPADLSLQDLDTFELLICLFRLLGHHRHFFILLRRYLPDYF
jgi:hypothetical protein